MNIFEMCLHITCDNPEYSMLNILKNYTTRLVSNSYWAFLDPI